MYNNRLAEYSLVVDIGILAEIVLKGPIMPSRGIFVSVASGVLKPLTDGLENSIEYFPIPS